MVIAISRKIKTLVVGCLTIRGFTETRVFSFIDRKEYYAKGIYD